MSKSEDQPPKANKDQMGNALARLSRCVINVVQDQTESAIPGQVSISSDLVQALQTAYEKFRDEAHAAAAEYKIEAGGVGGMVVTMLMEVEQRAPEAISVLAALGMMMEHPAKRAVAEEFLHAMYEKYGKIRPVKPIQPGGDTG